MCEIRDKIKEITKHTNDSSSAKVRMCIDEVSDTPGGD